MSARTILGSRGWGGLSLLLGLAAAGAAVWGGWPVYKGGDDSQLALKERLLPAAAVCLAAVLVGSMGRWGGRAGAPGADGAPRPAGPGFSLSTWGMYLGRLSMALLVAAGLYAISVGGPADSYRQLLPGSGTGPGPH
ncbi:MAG: hypothetical protein HYZ53_12605 [Planctomycetes bacterium]|nr:hypothetical protein [Planctomycetota bacterium]